jgi:hypothetical protein
VGRKFAPASKRENRLASDAQKFRDYVCGNEVFKCSHQPILLFTSIQRLVLASNLYYCARQSIGYFD